MRERVAHIPVVLSDGGGVGSMFAWIAIAIGFAIAALVVVVVAFPDQPHQPVTDCRPFCSVYNTTTPAAGGAQR